VLDSPGPGGWTAHTRMKNVAKLIDYEEFHA
jgi:hypothetical protein